MEKIINDEEFSIQKEGGFYFVYNGDTMLKTPGGAVAKTPNLPLAERLLEDWKKQGYDSYTSPSSILSYHFTMIDNFESYSKDALLTMFDESGWYEEWTLQSCPSPDPYTMMDWQIYFGEKNDRTERIKKWMHNCSKMQLVAATCVYNAFLSFNVSYFWAFVVETVPEKSQLKTIRQFYKHYSIFDYSFDKSDFLEVFKCFRLYYNIDFEKEGSHVPE